MANAGADGVPHLNLVCTMKEFNASVDNLLTGKSQPDIVPSSPTTSQEKPDVVPSTPTTAQEKPDIVPSTPTIAQEKLGAEDASSSTTNFMSAHLNVLHLLNSCLDYCYFVIYCSYGCQVMKNRLACLLVAEGLIKEDNSSSLKEDVASTVIDILIGLGMLTSNYQFSEWVGIPSTNEKIRKRNDRKNHFEEALDSVIRLYIVDGESDNLYPNLSGLTITSLFDLPAARRRYNRCISRAYMETICKLKSLVVLDLEGDVECLPNEIGDLVHLKYLRLSYYKLNDAPRSKSKFEQSFEIMFCYVDELPAEVLDIQRLWHLMINRNTINSKVEVPMKTGLRLSLFTLSGMNARGGITSELSRFTKLRRLEIYCVSDEHASELCAAIMKMTYLFSLSMEAEYKSYGEGEKKEEVALFPELEAFSPPSRLQEVFLTGQLVDIPTWLFTMENLSSLSLSDSYLLDDSIFVLQFLPNLKHLLLSNAIKAKHIGEEFCQAGGFPKLETLSIYSDFLVEWTDIANGAFPSLRCLTFSFCPNLLVFPNGLQNITTLDELYLFFIHGDLERRLQGIESYKINHIPKVVLSSR